MKKLNFIIKTAFRHDSNDTQQVQNIMVKHQLIKQISVIINQKFSIAPKKLI